MPFQTKRFLRNEVTRLYYRVKELEERLCPCESHKWKKKDYYFTGGTGMGDEEIIYIYKCSVCGKMRETFKHLEVD